MREHDATQLDITFFLDLLAQSGEGTKAGEILEMALDEIKTLRQELADLRQATSEAGNYDT
jgi:hypothetical protein